MLKSRQIPQIVTGCAPVEELELRRLLSVAAINTKSGPLASIGQDLAEAFGIYQNHAATTKPTTKLSDLLKNADLPVVGDSSLVAINTTAETDGKALETALRALGATSMSRSGLNVSALMPVDKLAGLAAIPSLAFARPVYARLNTGSVNAQSDSAIRASNARSTYGVNGSGVKVGVLSDSFDTGPSSYASDIATGDLPSGVSVLSDFAGGSDEGRAMAQLIYDSAPGVTLAFATAFAGHASFANNIKLLRDAGCKVIVDDVAYLDEPFFQDGIVAQAVDNVSASGVTYFSSAGNQARQSYDSTWRNGLVRAQNSIPVTSPNIFWGGTTFDFDPGAGTDDMASFTLASNSSVSISLQWDEPFKTAGPIGSSNDVDFYILNAAGTVVASSADENIGADPVEIVQFQNTTGSSGTFRLMVVRYTPAGGPTPGRLKFIDYDGDATGWEYAMNAGTISGHANSATGAGVAAARYDATPAFGVNPPQAESFSSYGNVPILFNTAGVRLGSVITRQQPLFTSVDGVDTTFFGQAYDGTSAPNFFGTSAAAPVAASVAALMLQAVPSLTPAQILTAMSNTAVDMDDSGTVGFDVGYDFLTGFGLVRADSAIASLTSSSIAGQIFEDRNGNGLFDGGEPTLIGLSVYIDSNSNGVFNAGEPTVVTSGAGVYTFANVTPGNYSVRQIVSSDYIVTSPAGNVHTFTVPAATAVTGKNFGNFPIVFTGTAGNDAYYVRASGSLTQIWTAGAVPPTAPTYSITKSLLPSLTFNAQAGDDTLVLDASLGDPNPTGGVSFNGGTQTTAAGDTLDVRGTGLADAFSVAVAGAVVHGAATTAYGTAETLKLSAGTYGVSADLGAINLNVTGATSQANFTQTQNLTSLTVSTGAVVNSASTNAAAPALVVTTVAITNGTLAVAPNGNLSGVSKFKSLTIAGTGALNLRNNDLVVDYTGGSTSFPLMLNYVQSGLPILGFGGSGSGITSTEVQNQTTAGTMFGVIDGATTGGLVTTLSGYSLPNPLSSVLIKYTWRGDANLDGGVNGSDYALADTGFSGGGSGWFYGDMNYIGGINGSDYALIDTGFSSQNSVL